MKSLKPSITFGAIPFRSDGEPIRTTHVVNVKIWVLSLEACNPREDLAASDKRPSSINRITFSVCIVALIDLPRNTSSLICKEGLAGGAPSGPSVPKYKPYNCCTTSESSSFGMNRFRRSSPRSDRREFASAVAIRAGRNLSESVKAPLARNLRALTLVSVIFRPLTADGSHASFTDKPLFRNVYSAGERPGQVVEFSSAGKSKRSFSNQEDRKSVSWSDSPNRLFSCASSSFPLDGNFKRGKSRKTRLKTMAPWVAVPISEIPWSNGSKISILALEPKRSIPC